MKCIHCQNEIDDKNTICPICGKTTRFVPDYSIYDDDNINVLLKGTEDIAKNQKSSEKKMNKKNFEERKKQENKKKIQLIVILISVVLLCAFMIAVGVFSKTIIDKRNANSYSYQLKMAQKSASEGKLSQAIKFYENAIRLQPDDLDSMFDLANLYFRQKNDTKAVNTLLEIIELDGSYFDAYKSLLKYYEKEEDLEAILSLQEKAVDEKTLHLFKHYMVKSPTIQLEEGTYKNSATIYISSNMKDTIYYTIDGSDPISNGIPYEKPISLSEKGDYTLLAVAKNDHDVFSEIVMKKYTIEVDPPALPIVSVVETGVTVNGGEFTKETYLSIEVPTGCSAYFTWDNTDPTSASESYTAPIMVPEGHHILSVLLIDNETELVSNIYRGSFDYFPE